LAVVEYHEIESLINEAFNSASLSSAESFDSQEHDFDFQDDEPLAIEEPANLTGDQTASTPESESAMEFDDEFGPAEPLVQTVTHGVDSLASTLHGEGDTPDVTPSVSHLTGSPHLDPAVQRPSDPTNLPEQIQQNQMHSQARIVPEQQVRVGMLQGLSMLGGAGLAGLTHMLHSGGSAINTKVQQRQYNKLAGEINEITSSMDQVISKLNLNGLARGMEDLRGNDRDMFLAEFMESQGNKSLVSELVSSVGALATKATNAAVVGAGAGLSPDEIDVQITKRISDIQEKHKQILDSLKDHNGTSLSDRLSNIAASISAVIDKLFQRAGQALGLGPRPGM
jgi:hypothetical protein